MNWQFSNDRPIYTQLVEQLQVFMVTDVFPLGSKLPPVRELSAQAGVNPNTMQRAMGELERQGLVHSQRTAGRFVTDDQQALQQVKQALAQAHLNHCLERIAALGYTKEEILVLLTQQREDVTP